MSRTVAGPIDGNSGPRAKEFLKGRHTCGAKRTSSPKRRRTGGRHLFHVMAKPGGGSMPEAHASPDLQSLRQTRGRRYRWRLLVNAGK